MKYGHKTNAPRYKKRTHFPARNRPRYLASGMTETSNRSRHRLKDAALTLAVRGTTDTLGRMLWITEFAPEAHCGCCGQAIKRLRLNDRGRRRLALLKRRQEARK